MKERRTLRGDDVRRLCIEKNWYTRGDCEEYRKVLKMADSQNVTTDLIVKIAEDIYTHSDKAYWKDCESDPVGNICFEIARICYSFFEQEVMRDFPGVMEIRNLDGSLVNAMMAHAKKAIKRPKGKTRSIGNTIGTTTYFATDDLASTYYNSLKSELDSQKEKTA